MELRTELGMRIRYCRKQQKISQETLAELADLHPTYIGQIERGEKNATIDSLFHISRGLNIPLSKLLENIGDFSDGESPAPLFPADLAYKLATLSPEKRAQLCRLLDDMLSFSEV